MNKIFISWSGKDSASFRVASKLNDILPLMFQNADYFFSDDITKGKPNIDKIFSNLAGAKVGIFCITKDNILKPWLNFEAGAISSAVENNDGLAIPLLINMTTDEFKSSLSPLANFQGAVFTDEKDFQHMIRDISKHIGSTLSEKQLDTLFDTYKAQFYNCDISDKALNSEKILSVIPEQNNETMTKDCRKFLRLLYNEYIRRKNDGESRSEAVHFETSEEVSDILNVPFEDVDYFTRQLGDMGFLKYEAADIMVMFSDLTEKGIKYGEDNFDEPKHISALRLILNSYNQSGKRNVYSKAVGVESKDIEILEELGYIKVISHYMDGSSSIKPIAKAFEFERSEM